MQPHLALTGWSWQVRYTQGLFPKKELWERRDRGAEGVGCGEGVSPPYRGGV